MTLATVTSAVASTVSSTTSATATCITGVPGKYGYVNPSDCNSLWNFQPSYSAAIAFSVLFAIVTVAHLTQGILYKKVSCLNFLHTRLLMLTLPKAVLLGSHNGLHLGDNSLRNSSSRRP
jgi:hypothetical protein